MTGLLTISEVIGLLIAGLLGGAGIAGLIMAKPKHEVEKRIKQADDDRERLNKVDQHDTLLEAIQEEQTVQCYCILACLKGLAEQGCNGPVHEGIDRMEKHLNKKAHGQ